MMENNKGSALALTMGVLIIVILLGTAGIRLSLEELKVSGLRKHSMEARYLTESLFGVVVQWFQEPRRFPGTEEDENFLARRLRDARGARSFFDAYGVSQFKGSRTDPDFLFRAENFLGVALGEDREGLGETSQVKIFRPESPDALCGIEATVTLGKGVRHRVGAELVPSPIPASTAALQVSSMEGPVSLKVHWGDIRVEGNADLGDALEGIPIKDSLALVNGESYGPVGRSDRWIDIRVGGRITNPSPSAEPACPECPRLFLEDGLPHVTQGEAAANPDWGIDLWDYQKQKHFAKEWGRYYRPDESGFLYADESGGRLRPVDVFSGGTGDARMGFIFIDTLDGLPPNGKNRASLRLPVDYIKGIFSVYADLVIDSGGGGRDMNVHSPSPERMGGGAGEPVRLESINLNGILSVAGRLKVHGTFRIFGVLRAEEGIGGPGEVEIWYNASYESGMIPGLPTVMVKKGTWFFQ